VGKNAFTHKAGLHVKAVMEEPKSYEAISPETVYRKRHIVIDKYTGKAALKNKLDIMGMHLKDWQLKATLKEIKAHPEKVSWKDDELISLANSIIIKV
jgi:2-isopropylmalate synthase